MIGCFPATQRNVTSELYVVIEPLFYGLLQLNPDKLIMTQSSTNCFQGYFIEDQRASEFYIKYKITAVLPQATTKLWSQTLYESIASNLGYYSFDIIALKLPI